jgi:PTS system nitrogen regulatory IIA component
VTLPAERLLTARELAELVGFSSSTVQDWAERGEVPAFKLGGRLRFRESEVLAWLEERRIVDRINNVAASGAEA